jgi:DNA-binding XRE family transcriptional regulator
MTIFVTNNNKTSIMDKDINRIKVVLAEKKRTNKWLAEQLGCAPTTVSKWCTNACQPPMETYIKIAKLLEVELSELVNSKFGDTI